MKGFGYSVFIPSQYNPANSGACAAGPNFCGFNGTAGMQPFRSADSRQRTLFWQPRFGLAYDLFGKGKHGAARRLGPVLLPLRPIYGWTGYFGGIRGSHSDSHQHRR